ncbi:MAG: beta-ketoacyl-[acyl-carrier-protein] synthase family protein [Deltaproteobacteria bacterium]|nr:beta-ketoacyl-[acyl-carrier-protein] synthase family protein [Deltaproteobacteria bacterium]
MGEVVITGLGAISPLGVGKKELWRGLTQGRNGIKEIVEFDTTPFRSKKGGLVKGFDPKAFIPSIKVRRLDRASQFAIASSRMALEDAGLKIGEDIPAERVGIILGSGFCGLANSEAFHRGQVLRGSGDLNPILFPNTVPNAAASNASIELGIKGPNSTVVQSFCTAEAAFVFGYQQLITKRADAILTGGIDELSPILYRGWNELHLTAWDEGEGERSAPYDLKRNGFIPGEGAGILVLERREDALRRRARIYGQILGFAATAGTLGPGEKVARSISGALKRGGVKTVDFIDGAGNSSPKVDAVEAEGIRLAIPNRYLNIPLSSIKSMVGEGIASGGIRMVADLLIMDRGVIPPTITYEYPDPKCGLMVVKAIQKTLVRTILHTGISLDGTYISILLGSDDGVL